MEQLKESGAKEAINLIRETASNIEDEGLIAGDVGARLGNTAQRMALGKGKKATYAAEKKAKKESQNKKRARDEDRSGQELIFFILLFV